MIEPRIQATAGYVYCDYLARFNAVCVPSGADIKVLETVLKLTDPHSAKQLPNRHHKSNQHVNAHQPIHD